MRLRVALALLAGGLLVTSCSVTRGSGQLATESREVSGFTKVELSGTGELTIEKNGDRVPHDLGRGQPVATPHE